MHLLGLYIYCTSFESYTGGMKQILLVTGNERKIGEARLACEPFGIEVVNQAFDIDEIQSTDPRKVSEHKARAAYALTGEPVVVTDTFWTIPALGGFPGAYMKEVAEWLTEQDFLNLMADKSDKRISFSENITYFDGQEVTFFTKEFWGLIVPPRGTGNHIENVAEFEGKTLGERRTEGGFSHKPEDYVWHQFAIWFSARNN